jgi:hypothetical protein
MKQPPQTGNHLITRDCFGLRPRNATDEPTMKLKCCMLYSLQLPKPVGVMIYAPPVGTLRAGYRFQRRRYFDSSLTG